VAIEQTDFRDALGCFGTGVTIITARTAEGELLGVTASSFNSVSLDPPLVLFSLHKKAYSLPAYLKASGFAVNVLTQGQEEMSNRFARALEDKWANTDYDTWETGSPILPGCLANFDCETSATYEGGDHMIFLGRVLRMRCHPKGEPLMFYRGGYSRLELLP